MKKILDDEVPNEIGLTDREIMFGIIIFLVAVAFIVIGYISTLKILIELNEKVTNLITAFTN